MTDEVHMFLINCVCLLSHDSDTCSKCKGLGIAVYQWSQLRPLTDEELLAACEASVPTKTVRTVKPMAVAA